MWWGVVGLVVLYALATVAPLPFVAVHRWRLSKGLPRVEGREALAALRADVAGRAAVWASRLPLIRSGATVAAVKKNLGDLQASATRLSAARDIIAFYFPEPLALPDVLRLRGWVALNECLGALRAIRDYGRSRAEIDRAELALNVLENAPDEPEVEAPKAVVIAAPAAPRERVEAPQAAEAAPATEFARGSAPAATPYEAEPVANEAAAVTDQPLAGAAPVVGPIYVEQPRVYAAASRPIQERWETAVPSPEAERPGAAAPSPAVEHGIRAAEPALADERDVPAETPVLSKEPHRVPEPSDSVEASGPSTEVSDVPVEQPRAEAVAVVEEDLIELTGAREVLPEAVEDTVTQQEADVAEESQISEEERVRALYKDALGGLQTGAWATAVAALEELLRLRPDDQRAVALLEEAQYKARSDKGQRVRAKGRVFPWRRIAFVSALAVVVVGFGLLAVRLFVSQLQPAMKQAALLHAQDQLYAAAMGLLEADDLEAAEVRFQQLLAQVPEHSGAQEGLRLVWDRRETRSLYEQAVATEEAGDYEKALQLYTEVSLRLGGYRDVTQRIAGLQREMRLQRLFAEAETTYEAGDLTDSLRRYEELRTLSAGFKPEVLAERIFELNVRLGIEIVEHVPPMAERIEEALAYFAAALSLRPSDSQAALEHRLASNYVEGMELYQSEDWDNAATALRTVYNQRPNYLGGVLVETLYDVYIRSGDQHRAAGDMGFAYEQYRRAASLPLADVALALERLQSVAPNLTPTPTPTATPTPTSTPRPTGTRRPTVAPTPRPMRGFHDYIVFVSEEENQPGFWAMRPDGSDRQYIGRSTALRQEYDAAYNAQHYSPDGRYKVYTGAQSQLFISLPVGETYRGEPWRQLTYMGNICYDPVWSPDGGRITFVSENSGSDDIWIINADGKYGRNLTPNDWPWEKHPSWSPDSRRIAFWSNRDGHMQIFVMYADGSGVQNISNTSWAERDPVWLP